MEIAPSKAEPSAAVSVDGEDVPIISLTDEERTAFNNVSALSRVSSFDTVGRYVSDARRTVEHVAAAIPVPASLIQRFGSRARVLTAGMLFGILLFWMVVSRVEAPKSIWAATSANRGGGGNAESQQGVTRELEALRKELGESHKAVEELKHEEAELKEELKHAKDEMKHDHEEAEKVTTTRKKEKGGDRRRLVRKIL